METLIDTFQDSEFTRMDHWSPNSEFRALLLSLPNGLDDKVSRISAIALGLLWCKGSNQQKAEVFFNTITQGKAQAVNNDDTTM